MADSPRRLHPTQALPFTLGQPWNAAPEPGLRPTRVHATFAAQALRVQADLDDDDVFTLATAHNQRTWELGDAFEIFVRRDDQEAYTEVHVTPKNWRLHLRFADFAQHRRIAGIDEVAADPDRIVTTAERTPAGWRATAVVPVPAGPGDLLRVSFCRYDASRGQPPVLSSSSPHPVLAFHRPREWTLCRITE